MEKKRILWVDALNVIACAGVLLLHCTNAQVHNFQGTVSFNWCLGLLTHSFFLWPVNVFFMLSGFTLLKNTLILDGGGREYSISRGYADCWSLCYVGI